MQRFGVLVALSAIFAGFSALMGLLIAWQSTWAAGRHAADTPLSRLIPWVVTFEDPDRPQLRVRADETEHGAEALKPR